jgi:hypothetical protein
MTTPRYNIGDIVVSTQIPGSIWKIVKIHQSDFAGMTRYTIQHCTQQLVERDEVEINLFYSHEVDGALPVGYTRASERKSRLEAGECVECGIKREMSIHGLLDCVPCSLRRA